MTKTIRSPFNHEVGGTVEGCTILEKHVVIPPDPAERRRGVYDYLVDVPPLPASTRSGKAASTRPAKAAKPAQAQAQVPESVGFTRASPDEMSSVIRRIGGR
jgi:hypothetical protein